MRAASAVVVKAAAGIDVKSLRQPKQRSAEPVIRFPITRTRDQINRLEIEVGSLSCPETTSLNLRHRGAGVPDQVAAAGECQNQ